MQKTKLGISVGLMGAAAYLATLFGGYVAAIIVVGYILLFEENPWLKRTGIKAMVLLVSFSLLSLIIGLIPDALQIIDNLVDVFKGDFDVAVVYKIESVLLNIVSYVKTIVFFVLGIKALKQSTLAIGFVEKVISKNS